MKISIIVPVYNVKDYLRDCIESVLYQSHKNFELILVNDGSTDNSAAICDEYSEKHPKCIKVLHISNGGPLKARLIGVKEASGDAIIFLDADDCLRTDALECIVKAFCYNDCDMVLYDAGESNNFKSLHIVHSLTDGEIFNYTFKAELYKKLLCGNIPNSLCLKAIRTECATYPEHLMQYDIRHGEDLLMSAYFISNCKNVVYLSEGLYFYRDRPGSAIHSFSIKRKESIKIVNAEIEKCIDASNMHELKSLHNMRKVKGWMDNLVLLMKNRRGMSAKEFKRELVSVADDPYFREAYENMDKSLPSKYYRLLSFLLYKRSYLMVRCLFLFVQLARKMIFRRKK